MPRNSSSGKDESPAPRRSSARIAACQVNKPASPSPAKKPTMKRKSKKVIEEDVLPLIEENKVDVNGFSEGNNVLDSGDANNNEPLVKKHKIDIQNDSCEKSNEDNVGLHNSVTEYKHAAEMETVSPQDTPSVEEPTINNGDNVESKHHTSSETEVPKDPVQDSTAEVEKTISTEIIENENIPVDADIKASIHEKNDFHSHDSSETESIGRSFLEEKSVTIMDPQQSKLDTESIPEEDGVTLNDNLQSESDTQSIPESNSVTMHDLPQSESVTASIPEDNNVHDLPQSKSAIDHLPSAEETHDSCSAGIDSEMKSDCQTIIENQAEEIVSQDVEAAH